MNIGLWIVQGLLAAAFLMAGFLKVTKSKEDLKKYVGDWVDDLPIWQIRTIGSLELLGAFGMILPMLFNIYPILTPIAAGGLILTMFGAMALHLRRKEAITTNIALTIMAGFVLYGRIFLVAA